MHRFIINADDFGISEPRSRGILQLIQKKRVTSVSVLVNGVNGQSVKEWSGRLRDYIMQRKGENG